eukprot:scaffold1104_cov299-Prasinococcus_capsulatus_cf.AAC.2
MRGAHNPPSWLLPRRWPWHGRPACRAHGPADEWMEERGSDCGTRTKVVLQPSHYHYYDLVGRSSDSAKKKKQRGRKVGVDGDRAPKGASTGAVLASPSRVRGASWEDRPPTLGRLRSLPRTGPGRTHSHPLRVYSRSGRALIDPCPTNR